MSKRLTEQQKAAEIQRIMVDAMTPKPAPTLAEQHEQLVEMIPDWEKPDIADAEKQILLQAAANKGMTQQEIASIAPDKVVKLRDETIEQLRAESLDRKVAAARAEAVAECGAENPDRVLGKLAQGLGIK